MGKKTFLAKNKFNLIGEISIILTSIFLIIDNKIVLFGISPMITLTFISLLGVWTVTKFFEKITISKEGIAYSSFFRTFLIPWNDIKNFSAYHQINKRELERLYLEDLETLYSNKNLLEKIFSYSNQINLYVSSESDFFPTKWTPRSKQYLYFDYTQEILEEIQRWLAINENI